MKPKALYILDTIDLIYGPQERDEIDQLVVLVALPQTRATIAEHPELLAKVEIILSGWGAPTLDAAFLDACPKLKAFLYGAGSVRSFVTDDFWERAILLSSAWAANAVPVSEYALAAILLGLKRFWQFSSHVKRERRYPDKRGGRVPGAFGSTVGIVSLGMIGRLVCQRLRSYDVHVIAYDPFVSAEVGQSLGVEMVSLEELFARADVISLHTPWLPATEGLITGELLASMKLNATLINTSRGAIVREQEMIAILRQRPDLWAVLDVVYPEPPVPGSPLYELPNVVLTPHIAGSMQDECRRMGQYVIGELKRCLAGEPLKWGLTKERAAQMA